jgi:hypothetical protein
MSSSSTQVNLLAIIHDASLPSGVGAISVINRYYARSVPIGGYTGEVGNPSSCAAAPAWVNHCNGWYTGDLTDHFPADEAAPHRTSLEVYRSVLAAAADGSVTIASVGFATNLLALLSSPTDSVSGLTGAELIKRKVRRMYMMGGRRSNDPRWPVEWNFGGCNEGDIEQTGKERCDGGYSGLGPKTKYVINRWPATVPLVFVGFEDSEWIRTGDALLSGRAAHLARSPIRRSFHWYCAVMPNRCEGGGRSSWDPVTVLIAIRDAKYGDEHYHKESGIMSVTASGGACFSYIARGT